MKNLSNIVKNIDAYPKTLEDFTIKTFSGAIGIVGNIFLILNYAFFFFTILYYYIAIIFRQEVVV